MLGVMSTFGDQPKFYPMQRLALPEVLGLRDVSLDNDEQAYGAMFGACEGLLSAPEHEFETLGGGIPVIRLKAMTLVGIKNQGSAVDKALGGFFLFSPTDAQQNQTYVPITGYEGETGVIWWRAFRADTTMGNFRKIEAGFPKGRIYRGPSRESVRGQFKVTPLWTTPHSDGLTWYRLATFDWTDDESPPIVTFLHAFDQGRHLSPTVATKYFLGQTMAALHAGDSNLGRSYGVGRALAFLTNQILNVMSSTHAWNPVTGHVGTPGALGLADTIPRGVFELDRDLGLNEDVVAAYGETLTNHTERIVALEDRGRVLYTATLFADGSSAAGVGDFVAAGGVVTATKTGTGVWSIVFGAAIASNARVHVQAADPSTIKMFTRGGQSNVTTCYVETYDADGAPGNLRCTVMIVGKFA